MGQYERLIVLVTASNGEEGRHIARVLLNARLAACVNILSNVDSLYWWRGKLESAAETLLVIKTRAELLPEIVATVKKEHSYEVPEIVALPVFGGNEDYLAWVDDSVKKTKPTS